MPQQSELAEIADSSDLSNLHRASKHITSDIQISCTIGSQLGRPSQKSHMPVRRPAMNDRYREAGGLCSEQVIDLGQ
jgi:hypothetical protein